MFLLESYDFRVLVRLSRFLLQVALNKGSNKGHISFCPINSKKCQFLCLRLSRFLLQVTSNKWSIKGHTSFCPINSQNANSYVFLLESYDFLVLVRLPRFLLQVASNKGSNKGHISFCPINSRKCQFLCVFARK